MRSHFPHHYGIVLLFQKADPKSSPDEQLQVESVTSIKKRFIFWRNTLLMIKDHPLKGAGIGNFSVLYPLSIEKGTVDETSRFGVQVFYAHNDYLQVVAELGFVLAGFLLWVIVLLFRQLFDILKKSCPVGGRHLGVTSFIAMAGLGINAFFSFPLYRAVPPLFTGNWSP